jgi:hypothetical protein
MLAFSSRTAATASDVRPRVSGQINKDDFVSARNGKKVKVGRLVRMPQMTRKRSPDRRGRHLRSSASTATRVTRSDGTVNFAMTSMFVPNPAHLGRDRARFGPGSA